MMEEFNNENMEDEAVVEETELNISDESDEDDTSLGKTIAIIVGGVTLLTAAGVAAYKVRKAKKSEEKEPKEKKHFRLFKGFGKNKASDVVDVEAKEVEETEE